MLPPVCCCPRAPDTKGDEICRLWPEPGSARNLGPSSTSSKEREKDRDVPSAIAPFVQRKQWTARRSCSLANKNLVLFGNKCSSAFLQPVLLAVQDKSG